MEERAAGRETGAIRAEASLLSLLSRLLASLPVSPHVDVCRNPGCGELGEGVVATERLPQAVEEAWFLPKIPCNGCGARRGCAGREDFDLADFATKGAMFSGLLPLPRQLNPAAAAATGADAALCDDLGR